MAGAMAGMVLADNGADVVKVEAPTGDPTRTDDGFRVWNRAKRSVVLDLHRPDERDHLLDLVADADAVISDLRPGVAERLGITHDALAAVNPSVVTVTITGFGERGPLRELPGYEGIVAARTGRMATLKGYRDGPVFTPTPIASYGAAMLAVQGLLAAIHQRRSTGRGQRVHTSLLHALVAFDMISGYGHRIHEPDHSGRVFGVMPLAFMTAEAKDGRFVQMCSRAPHLFRNWLRVLGLEHLYADPALATMPDLLPSHEELERVRKLVAAAMRERTLDEWLDIFLREDVGGDPFLSAEEFLRHPQAIENGRVAFVDDPTVGRSRQIGPLGQFDGTPSEIGRGAPLLGEHTREVLDAVPPRSPIVPAAPSRPERPTPPLDGVTVLEVGYFYAAPFAMTLLTEMGARVIKVEPPSGDPARRNWASDYDKETVGKESVIADMKTPEGLAIVHRLAAQADVFLHNFRPGVPERLGIGYEAIHALNPRLVYVYGGCFGSRGPWAHRPGFHSSPNAIAGSGIIEAGVGNPPINRTYADPASALAVAAATLVALHGRDLTGEGQYVETTMLSSMAYTVSRWSVQYDGKARGPLPDEGQHGFHALHRLYGTANGWLFLQCATEREWRALVLALDEPMLAEARFADGQSRLAHDDLLVAILAGVLARRGAADWERHLLAAGVPAVRADGIDHLQFMIEDEHMRANGLSVPATLPDGTAFWRSAGSVEFSEAPTRLGSPEPLGRSTVAVLHEIGYDDDAIADLERRGVTRPVGHGLDG